MRHIGADGRTPDPVRQEHCRRWDFDLLAPQSTGSQNCRSRRRSSSGCPSKKPQQGADNSNIATPQSTREAKPPEGPALIERLPFMVTLLLWTLLGVAASVAALPLSRWILQNEWLASRP